MSWFEYFYKTPRPLGEQAKSYTRVVQSLKERYPEVLPLDVQETFILGGFHPSNGTPEHFRKLCNVIHPNPNNKIIYLDQSEFSTHTLRKNGQTSIVQAQLELPPFLRGSIDLIVNDFTLDFMSDLQLDRYAKRMNEVLSPGGLVLAATCEPRLLAILQYKIPVKVYPRSIGELAGCMPGLRLLYSIKDPNDANISAFGSIKSEFFKKSP